jgi:hypothetical protein
MEFDLEKSIEILERTPSVLKLLLSGLHNDWIINNEGGDSWSPFDIVGHLIHGEKTDWVVRTKIILSDTGDKKFEPFDRFAQFEKSKGKSLQELLNEFDKLREENISFITGLNISEQMLDKTGIHPEFGNVTLRQLLAAWTAHDLSHIAQAARVMAKQYKEASGPWVEYLPIMNPHP